MKRLLLLVVLAAVLAALCMAPTLAIARSEQTSAEGEWTWVNESFREMVHRNGNAFLRGDEAGTWTGTFDGESHDDFIGLVNASGELHGMLLVEFDNVSVNGAVGGLRMRLSWYVNESYSFGGQWKIVSGSGELRHLRGEGQWQWYDDVGAEGGARYSGITWEQ